jgi:ABC-type glutathione transport system ATPase component
MPISNGQPAGLLKIENLSLTYYLQSGVVFPRIVDSIPAVKNVSYELRYGEILGVVGESGCGKSSLLRASLLLEPGAEGKVLYRGDDLFGLSPFDLGEVRRRIQLVYQNPASSLNPVFTALDAASEALDRLNPWRKKDQSAKAAAMLERVGIPTAILGRKISEFSAGQLQRIAIARAMAVQPEILFADEIVSSLDVSVQAQVLNLLKGLRREFDLSVVLVSHDLSVVRNICDRVLIMKKGEVVEEGDAEEVFGSPKTQYTRELIKAAAVTGAEE